MVFGELLNAAPSSEPAAWIAESTGGETWTVGSLVPDRFETRLRLHAPTPEPDADTWWQRYRDLFSVVASVGARHTTSPDVAWFAVWEGHGFDRWTTHVAWPHPPVDDAERRWRELERRRVSAADDKRMASIARTLASIPRFHLPHRAYYLMRGPLSAVGGMRYPDGDGWRNPDLFWPDDRSWFAATDVDFWSLFVGGTRAFLDELSEQLVTPAELVGVRDRLPVED